MVGLQTPPGKTLQQMMRGLRGVLAQGMVEQGVYTLAILETREIFVQFGTLCLTQGGHLPGWWPMTELAQQPVGMMLVAALMELCVMQ